jgi:hypothetical protein
VAESNAFSMALLHSATMLQLRDNGVQPDRDKVEQRFDHNAN